MGVMDDEAVAEGLLSIVKDLREASSEARELDRTFRSYFEHAAWKRLVLAGPLETGVIGILKSQWYNFSCHPKLQRRESKVSLLTSATATPSTAPAPAPIIITAVTAITRTSSSSASSITTRAISASSPSSWWGSRTRRNRS
jgi:hypothetical protein